MKRTRTSDNEEETQCNHYFETLHTYLLSDLVQIIKAYAPSCQCPCGQNKYNACKVGCNRCLVIHEDECLCCFKTCNSCRERVCLRCITMCGECESNICSQCGSFCDGCHAFQCDVCNEDEDIWSFQKCTDCGYNYCTDCAEDIIMECDTCFDIHCLECRCGNF